MKNLKSKSQFRALLLAISFFSGPLPLINFATPLAHAEAAIPEAAVRTGIEDYRRSILFARVARIVEARERALQECRATVPESALISEIETLHSAAKDFGSRGTEGLLALMKAYALTSKIKQSKSSCGKKISEADLNLLENDRKKFSGLRTAARLLTPSQFQIAPSEWLFMELDPWCASDVQPNYNGERDGNPCFAGEHPILGALRDPANRKTATYFDSAMETDGFLSRLAEAAEGPARVLPLEKLFSPGLSRRALLAIMTYLYAAGTSELGWVDGFGESFWRTALDQGASPRTALSQYLSWLNRKDAYVVLRKKLHSRGQSLQLLSQNVEAWNHHEFISAFLACNYESRGDDLLARTVPEALGVAYESRDFASHLREQVGFRRSTESFITDVRRHQTGGHFGRTACGT
ncbi:MAG: hypothetical protein H7222_03425 [Methylotenera sp.]|nr:hypothetical protein [Oligoflexia bacterium]